MSTLQRSEQAPLGLGREVYIDRPWHPTTIQLTNTMEQTTQSQGDDVFDLEAVGSTDD